MIPNINKIIRILTLSFLLFLNTSCKSEGENKKNEVLTTTTEIIELKDSSDIELKESDKSIDGDTYEFYQCFYLNKDEYDNPTLYEDQIYNHFKDLKIKILNKNTISINGNKSPFSIENIDSKKYFRRDYEYKSAIKSFKYGFDIDIENKKLKYLWLDPLKNTESPFKELFEEGGNALVFNDLIFLKKYEGYMICYKKRDKSINKNENTCKLPFYTGRAEKYCREGMKGTFKFLCEEYPIHYIEKDKNLKTELEMCIKNKILLYYYKLETGISDISTLVVVTEHEEESTGDLFLINIKNNKVVSLLEDNSKIFLDNDSNNFFHAHNFEVMSDLSIIIYEDNQMRPKNKVIAKYKITSSGTFSKIK
jgi:hypothetical protein